MSFVHSHIMRRRSWGWDLNPGRAAPEPTVLQHPFWKQEAHCGVERDGASEGCRVKGEGWEVGLGYHGPGIPTQELAPCSLGGLGSQRVAFAPLQ